MPDGPLQDGFWKHERQDAHGYDGRGGHELDQGSAALGDRASGPGVGTSYHPKQNAAGNSQRIFTYIISILVLFIGFTSKGF